MSARVRIEQRVGDGPSRVTLAVEVESDFVNVDGLTECALGILERVGLDAPVVETKGPEVVR